MVEIQKKISLTPHLRISNFRKPLSCQGSEFSGILFTKPLNATLKERKENKAQRMKEREIETMDDGASMKKRDFMYRNGPGSQPFISLTDLIKGSFKIPSYMATTFYPSTRVRDGA